MMRRAETLPQDDEDGGGVEQGGDPGQGDEHRQPLIRSDAEFTGDVQRQPGDGERDQAEAEGGEAGGRARAWQRHQA